jgi:ribose 5-phosphate isomerase B
VRIAFGTDEHTPLADEVVERLRAAGHEVDVVAEGAPWPDVGREVGEAVARGTADRGVVCCWTGTGVSMAANKVRGVRAALCNDLVTARLARAHNDANVLSIGARVVGAGLAEEILATFLASEFEGGRHARRVAQLTDLEAHF